MLSKMNLFGKFRKESDADSELKEIESTKEIQDYYRTRKEVSIKFNREIEPVIEALQTLEESDKCKVVGKIIEMYKSYLQELSQAKDVLRREQSSYIYDKEVYSLEIIEYELSFVRNRQPNNTNFDIIKFLNLTKGILINKFIK
ncbi:hypothetical protein UT300012_21760 [Paraclostridium bifermentans]